VKVAPLEAPALHSERLTLRMLQESDFEQYWELHRDPDVTRYTTRTQLKREEAWRHLAVIVGHWHLRGFGMWGVFEKETQRLCGRVGFHQPDGWPDFELGWTLGRAFWGKGYASEAAARCVRFAFEEMGRDHLISLIDPENVGSIKVAERIGETLQGEWTLGEHRLLIYGIRRSP
jgi:RimJ/RimL family protein N-acetyltransferase